MSYVMIFNFNLLTLQNKEKFAAMSTLIYSRVVVPISLMLLASAIYMFWERYRPRWREDGRRVDGEGGGSIVGSIVNNLSDAR